MLDQLRQIAIFAKTVDHGSFRAAARALDISPSVVSHHIAKLEERLGAALLYRSTRKLSLTEDGKRLLVQAHLMIGAAEAGLQMVADRGRHPSGVLNVTIPAVLAQSALIERVALFCRAYPNVHLKLDFSDQRREVIGSGIDVAIRMGWLKDSSLKARKLYDVQRTLVAAPEFLKSKPVPLRPSEVEDWEWLELSAVRVRPSFKQAGQEPVQISPSYHLSANDANALYRLARSGAGIVVLPEYLSRPDVADGRMIRLLTDWELEPIGVFAVWPPNAPKEGLTALFIDTLVNPNKPDQN